MKKIFLEQLLATGKVTAFYTTKEEGYWHYDVEDGPRQYKELAEDLGITTSQMVRTKQTHTNGVKLVDMSNGGEGVDRDYGASGFDGMITNTKDLLLCTLEADCVPVFILDPVQEAIANVHSGWRGTVGQISANAIMLMQEKFGSKPEDMLVAIGPCICGDCYEVSEDLLPPFAEKYTAEEMAKLFAPKPNNKYLLDLKQAIKFTVTKLGVKPENVIDSGYCTYHQDLFDSHRKNGGKNLRMLSGIMLRRN